MMNEAEYRQFVQDANVGRILVGVDRLFARRVFTNMSLSAIRQATVLAIFGFFILQNCSQARRPKLTQDIPVTSNPVGARIIVDTKDAGRAPLILSLKKNGSHRIRRTSRMYRACRRRSPATTPRRRRRG